MKLLQHLRVLWNEPAKPQITRRLLQFHAERAKQRRDAIPRVRTLARRSVQPFLLVVTSTKPKQTQLHEISDERGAVPGTASDSD